MAGSWSMIPIRHAGHRLRTRVGDKCRTTALSRGTDVRDDACGGAVPCNTKTQRLQENRPMKRSWIRWMLLLVVVFMQTGCLCWRHCPPSNNGVQWHTPPYGYDEGV